MIISTGGSMDTDTKYYAMKMQVQYTQIQIEI